MDRNATKTLLFSANSTMGWFESGGVSVVVGWGKENMDLKTGDALDNMTL